jgi:hypothetical protein
MENFMKALLARFLLSVIITASFGAAFLVAQNTPPSAPLPSGLSAAKTAFISDATGQSLVTKDYSPRPYNNFYAALKNWGHYQIVSSPAEADLILEFRVTTYPVRNGLSLTVLDTKTHVAIWAFSVELFASPRKGTRAKYLDQAASTLTSDLKNVVEEASKQ